VGKVLHEMRIPLRAWLLAISLLAERAGTRLAAASTLRDVRWRSGV
jgi:hypothetical protein